MQVVNIVKAAVNYRIPAIGYVTSHKICFMFQADLRRHGASVDVASSGIWRPLFVAAQNGHVEVSECCCVTALFRILQVMIAGKLSSQQLKTTTWKQSESC